MEITQQEFRKLADFIEEKSGNVFPDDKINFIKRRIESLASDLQLESFDKYYRYLKFYDSNEIELQKLVNEITTNESYFFREFDQLAAFAEVCLADLEKKRIKYNNRRMKVWCAACSTGEEAYTLAIILNEMIENIDDWNIEIKATDIDTGVLSKAKKGLYNARSVKFIPPEYYSKYIYSARGGYKVVNKLKEIINFQQFNFMDFAKFSEFQNYDFIFCRNALIYFNDNDRKKIVEHFYESLIPQGYLFLGHSESIGRITDKFKSKKVNDMILYYKV